MILAGDSDAAKGGARSLGEERRGEFALTAQRGRGKGKRKREEEGPKPGGSSYNGCVSRGAFQSLEHAFQYTIRDNLFSLIHPTLPPYVTIFYNSYTSPKDLATYGRAWKHTLTRCSISISIPVQNILQISHT